MSERRFLSLTRGKRLAIVMAAMGLAVVAAGAFPLTRAILDWRHRIPVVRTWGELLAQTPIDAELGVKVHLGIEARSCQAGSGVLLYCLAEGLRQNMHWEHRDILGALHISVQGQGMAPIKVSTLDQERQLSPKPRNLYLLALPVPRPGSVEIQVASGNGKLLRRGAVQGTTAPFHPWSPLRLPEFQQGLGWSHTTRGTLVFSPCKCGPGIEALPTWDGVTPYVSSEASGGNIDPNLPLPALLPAAPSSELKLEVQGRDLVLKSAGPIDLGAVRDRFLARWWVNGEPFVPERTGTPSPDYRDRNDAVELRLHLSWPERAGSPRSGDRIGAQLLYCGKGWSYVHVEDRSRVARDISHSALLTNKVEFVLP